MAKMDWTAIMDLAGAALGGTDYVQKRMEQLQFEADQEDREDRKKLEKRDREIAAMRELASLFEPAGEERLSTGPSRVRESETIPVMEDASGGLVSDPSQPSQPIAMNTGLGQGYDQALGLYTQGMDPASANMVRGGAIGIAQQRAVGEREDFERGTQQLIERERTVDTALEPERLERDKNRERELGKVRIDLGREEWLAMDDLRKADYLWKAGVDHGYRMAEVRARENVESGGVSRTDQIVVNNYAKGQAVAIVKRILEEGADPDEAIREGTLGLLQVLRSNNNMVVPYENVWGALATEVRYAGGLGNIGDEPEEVEGEGEDGYSGKGRN